MTNEYPRGLIGDTFTRRDELLIILNENLKLIQQALGQIPGGNGGTTPTIPSDKIKKFYIANVPLGAANSEVLFQFPLGTKSFVMHSRNGNAVRIGFETGVVAASLNPYFTLKANTAYDETDLAISDFSQKFYLSCAAANEVLEIIIRIGV